MSKQVEVRAMRPFPIAEGPNNARRMIEIGEKLKVEETKALAWAATGKVELVTAEKPNTKGE